MVGCCALRLTALNEITVMQTAYSDAPKGGWSVGLEGAQPRAADTLNTLTPVPHPCGPTARRRRTRTRPRAAGRWAWRARSRARRTRPPPGPCSSSGRTLRPAPCCARTRACWAMRARWPVSRRSGRLGRAERVCMPCGSSKEGITVPCAGRRAEPEGGPAGQRARAGRQATDWAGWAAVRGFGRPDGGRCSEGNRGI